MLPLAAVNDPEGARLPASLPPVIDGHVHLFPDPVFEAIWRWFDVHAWPVRYKLRAREVVRFLLDRGVERIVALMYAHKPGLARPFNDFMAEIARDEPRVVGMATVMPGEPGAARILEDAFAAGLAGVKLHCHVQCIGVDDPRMEEIYEACVRADKPVVVHAGREPSSPAYKCDVYAICSADRVERVLRDHPRMKLCIPHLGADEFDAYERLLERHDNLWLDTTMVVADFFPMAPPERLLRCRPERVLYGTDFPNLPFAWDREIVRLVERRLDERVLAALLGETARALYGLPPAPPTPSPPPPPTPPPSPP